MKRQILTLVSAIALATAANISIAGGNAAAGKAKAATCAGCHGPKGISMVPMYPNLAGQKEAYLVKQINNFKEGVRKDPTMNAMVKALSDEDVANVAAYYANMK